MYRCENDTQGARKDELEAADASRRPNVALARRLSWHKCVFSGGQVLLSGKLENVMVCTWYHILGVLIVKYPRRGSLYKRLVYGTDFRMYIRTYRVNDTYHNRGCVYIRMVDVQIFNSARVFTQTRCIVGITLCDCVWLFDKTIPPGYSFYLYNPPIAQRYRHWNLAFHERERVRCKCENRFKFFNFFSFLKWII